MEKKGKKKRTEDNQKSERSEEKGLRRIGKKGKRKTGRLRLRAEKEQERSERKGKRQRLKIILRRLAFAVVDRFLIAGAKKQRCISSASPVHFFHSPS